MNKTQVDHAHIQERVKGPSHREATIAMKPRIRSFDQPATAVTPQPTAVVPRRPHPVLAVGDDRHEPLRFQVVSQGVRIVTLVGDHRRAFGHRQRDVLQGRQQQLLFGDLGAGHRQAQGQASGVGDYLQLHALANLGLTDVVTPFFARMKVASASNSRRSTRPKSASCPTSTAWISSRIPSPAHSCRRRQQVLPEGRSTGMSCQRAPERSSHSSPSRHSRSSARGRPPLGEGGCCGSKGAMRCHCSSVNTRLVFRDMIGSFRRPLELYQQHRTRPVLKQSLATSYLGAGIFLAPLIAGREPHGQRLLSFLLLAALVVVVVGSLSGEAASYKGWLPHDAKPLLGAQGWEYLDLGRLWQILLVGGLVLWCVILYRGLRGKLADESHGNLPYLFFYSALSIPLFYAVGLVNRPHTNFAIADFWRFWVVHLWVEDFLELFTTIMVAYVFVLLGVVSEQTATRVIYFDALLYSVGGVVGTMHHLYFSGTPAVHMALGAFFSAAEVIPLTFLTVEAWTFLHMGARQELRGGEAQFPHRWAVLYLAAVGFWNFLGAGVFGFLINLPVVSYYEIGTQLTANHGHASMMGVYGMLAIALLVFCLRYLLRPEDWSERGIGFSFWALNLGLAWMVFANLFPIGVLQLGDAVAHGYWHARSIEFFNAHALIEWLRLPGDVLFIAGVVPLVYLTGRAVFRPLRPAAPQATPQTPVISPLFTEVSPGSAAP